MEQKDPEKKIPSTAAKAINRSAKLSELLIHRRAQSAFFLTQGSYEEILKKSKTPQK